jgi:hypothetical protein
VKTRSLELGPLLIKQGSAPNSRILPLRTPSYRILGTYSSDAVLDRIPSVLAFKFELNFVWFGLHDYVLEPFAVIQVNIV